MNKFIVCFCEGMHDISFIERILKLNNFEGFNNELNFLPVPFNELFCENSKKNKIKAGFTSNYKNPSVICKKDDTYVFLHNLNGDKREGERTKLLEQYKNNSSGSDFNPKLNYRFLYFFDADDLGVPERIKILNKELNMKLSHANFIKHVDYEYGCYIFSKPNGKGTLEDVLIDLIDPSDHAILAGAETYLTNFKVADKRKKECQIDKSLKNCSLDGCKGKDKYEKNKSILSVIGQLQLSGMSNNVIISKSDFFPCQTLLANKNACDIFNLFI